MMYWIRSTYSANGPYIESISHNLPLFSYFYPNLGIERFKCYCHPGIETLLIQGLCTIHLLFKGAIMPLNEVRVYKSLDDCIKKQPSSVISSEELSKELWTKKPSFNNGKRKQPVHKNNNHLFVPQA